MWLSDLWKCSEPPVTKKWSPRASQERQQVGCAGSHWLERGAFCVRVRPSSLDANVRNQVHAPGLSLAVRSGLWILKANWDSCCISQKSQPAARFATCFGLVSSKSFPSATSPPVV